MRRGQVVNSYVGLIVVLSVLSAMSVELHGAVLKEEFCVECELLPLWEIGIVKISCGVPLCWRVIHVKIC